MDKLHTSKEGAKYWSPLDLIINPISRKRPDCQWEYANQKVKGSYHNTDSKINLDDSYVHMNFFDKIKVVTCCLITDFTTWSMSLSGVANMERIGINGKYSNGFLQEVYKHLDKTTITRYNVSDNQILSNSLHSLQMFSININTTKGLPEIFYCIHSYCAWLVSCNPNSVTAQFVKVRQNNNALTIDSIISSVTNEMSFMSNLLKANPQVSCKPQFRTHKCFMKLPLDRLKGLENKYDSIIDKALHCKCTKCSRRISFEEEVDKKTPKYIDLCLFPLKCLDEIQVHTRCINSSGIKTPLLMSLLTNFFRQMLDNEDLIKVDLALANSKSQLEKQSNGLLPLHANMLCEIICWRARTRLMTRRNQCIYYEQNIKPLLSKITFSRYNIAQAGNFFNYLIPGDRMITSNDINLISYKYKNLETIKIFKNEKYKYSKHVKRCAGIVYYFYTNHNGFNDKAKKWDIDTPTASEL